MNYVIWMELWLTFLPIIKKGLLRLFHFPFVLHMCFSWKSIENIITLTLHISILFCRRISLAESLANYWVWSSRMAQKGRLDSADKNFRWTFISQQRSSRYITSLKSFASSETKKKKFTSNSRSDWAVIFSAKVASYSKRRIVKWSRGASRAGDTFLMLIMINCRAHLYIYLIGEANKWKGNFRPKKNFRSKSRKYQRERAHIRITIHHNQ